MKPTQTFNLLAKVVIIGFTLSSCSEDSDPDSPLSGDASMDDPSDGGSDSDTDSDTDTDTDSDLDTDTDSDTDTDADGDTDDTDTDQVEPEETIQVMSLNIFGHDTMPHSAATFAALIKDRDPDVVGIQEGVQDWLIGPGMPTDYSRADALGTALGSCWDQRYQIFIDVCKDNAFLSSDRFDLTDGPNATRTGNGPSLARTDFSTDF